MSSLGVVEMNKVRYLSGPPLFYGSTFVHFNKVIHIHIMDLNYYKFWNIISSALIQIMSIISTEQFDMPIGYNTSKKYERSVKQNFFL